MEQYPLGFGPHFLEVFGLRREAYVFSGPGIKHFFLLRAGMVLLRMRILNSFLIHACMSLPVYPKEFFSTTRSEDPQTHCAQKAGLVSYLTALRTSPGPVW